MLSANGSLQKPPSDTTVVLLAGMELSLVEVQLSHFSYRRLLYFLGTKRVLISLINLILFLKYLNRPRISISVPP